MDLFLRRVTTSLLARVVLSLLYGFSPYVLSSLAVSHLMTAWIGVLPLIALGTVDALDDDRATCAARTGPARAPRSSSSSS